MPKIIGQSDQTFTVLQDNGSVTSIARDAISPELVSEISGFGSAIENEAPIIPEAQPVQEQVVNEPVLEEAPIEQAPPSRLDRALGAETRIADIQAKTAQETLQNLRANDAATRAFDLEQREREAERSKQFDEFALKAEKASEEFAKAEIKDPYASKSTGNKILSAISLGLGAFGAALTGGENTAMKIINSAIDRDIEIQKADINKKGDAVQNSRNLLADLTKKFGDERVAEAMTRRLLLESALRQNNITAAKFQGPLIQANSQKNKTVLEQAIQEQDLKISQLGTNVLDKRMDIAKKQKELSDGPELKLTPAQKAVDVSFAKTFQEFFIEGGFADAQKGITQLNESLSKLESGASLTGPLQGLAPDFIRRFTNEEAISVRDSVEEVVQRNLRIVLGAQFTEKEGERLIARAFDETLSEEENTKRVKRLVGQMQRAMIAKKAAGEYFEANGTLKGFKGTLLSDIATAEDFENANFEEAQQDSGSGLTPGNIEWARQNTKNPDPAKAQKAQTILDRVGAQNNPAPVRPNR